MKYSALISHGIRLVRRQKSLHFFQITNGYVSVSVAANKHFIRLMPNIEWYYNIFFFNSSGIHHWDEIRPTQTTTTTKWFTLHLMSVCVLFHIFIFALQWTLIIITCIYGILTINGYCYCLFWTWMNFKTCSRSIAASRLSSSEVRSFLWFCNIILCKKKFRHSPNEIRWQFYNEKKNKKKMEVRIKIWTKLFLNIWNANFNAKKLYNSFVSLLLRFSSFVSVETKTKVLSCISD